MTKRLQVYEGEGIVVTFDPNVCIHSGACLRALPEVFDVQQRRWIQLEHASAEAVAAAVAKCPSGALQSRRPGTIPAAPGTDGPVQVIVNRNGPLSVRGRVLVEKENGDLVDKPSCALCRCGGTQNAPFCDGTHTRLGFRSPS